MRDGRGFLVNRPWLRPWIVVGLAAWTTLGVVLVTRANNFGLIDDISISPYHLVGYAALLVLGLYVAGAFFGALRRSGWRSAFPRNYGGLGLAFLLLVAWVIVDPIWRSTLGINQGVENGLAPPRLLIPIALVVLAAGPLREALALRAEPGLRRDELRVRWAGVAATGLIGGAVTLAAFNPIQSPVSDWAYRPAVDNAEVWSMAADGSSQTRLLAARGDGVDYSLPAWSPDGSRIAYTTWTNDDGAPQSIRFEAQTASIWTMAADGSDQRQLVDGGEGNAWIPAWSPDGQWLAYTRSPRPGVGGAAGNVQPQPNAPPGPAGPPSPANGATIWIVGADGSGARQVSPDGLDALGAAWSPDGTRLAFVAAASGGVQRIQVGTLTASGLTDLVTVGADRGSDWGPTWSPDGSRVTFVSDRTGNDEVWIAPADGSLDGIRQLTDSPGGDWVPAFSPDGARIGFVSDRTGEPEIWSMAADGSDLRNLTLHPSHLDGTWSVSWSPDGSRLAYGSSAFQDPVTSSWVREDLAVAQALLFGIALAALALVVAALGAPFGAFTAVLLLVAVISAVPVDGWHFLPAALAGGLAVDLLVRVVPLRWRSRVAAASLPAFANLALGLTIGLAGSLFWSLTLLLGVTLASGVIGWGLASLAERLQIRPPSPPTARADRPA